ncbi:hypothetical protein J6590_035578 [Homalodisca vitripennis]|nr:hypothetical protein J6590_035578 [Homalodisca vitripennis]
MDVHGVPGRDCLTPTLLILIILSLQKQHKRPFRIDCTRPRRGHTDSWAPGCLLRSYLVKVIVWLAVTVPATVITPNYILNATNHFTKLFKQPVVVQTIATREQHLSALVDKAVRADLCRLGCSGYVVAVPIHALRAGEDSECVTHGTRRPSGGHCPGFSETITDAYFPKSSPTLPPRLAPQYRSYLAPEVMEMQ